MSPSLFILTYGVVFLAELVGDKALYTISTLTTRHRPVPVFCGIALAFMGKMLAAVLIGHVIAELPAALVAGTSAAVFFIMGLTIWLEKPGSAPIEPQQPRYWSMSLLIAFAAIFFSEWADVGQITAATLAARYQAPFTVWLAATLAMVTKGTLAMTLGIGLRAWLPRPALRYGASVVCVAMGIMALFRID
jgi:Ca2+/H+ antiporter, TMEM165/GDT1 family